MFSRQWWSKHRSDAIAALGLIVSTLALIVSTLAFTSTYFQQRDFRVMLMQGNGERQLGVGARMVFVNAGNRPEAFYEVTLSVADPKFLDASTLLRRGDYRFIGDTVITSDLNTWAVIGPTVLKPGDVFVDSLWVRFPPHSVVMGRPPRPGASPSIEDSLYTFVVHVRPVTRDGRVHQAPVSIPIETFVTRDGSLQQLPAELQGKYPRLTAGWVRFKD